MRSYQPSSDRRRVLSLALTIAAHCLIVFLLLRLAPVFDAAPETGRSLTVTMLPVGDHQAPAAAARAKAPAASAAKASRDRTPEPPAPPKPPLDETPVPPPDTPFPGYIMLSQRDYAASDVGKMPSRRQSGGAGRELASADQGQGDADSGDSSAGAGTGPSGQRLYAAEWYVRPARSQTDPYMPRTLPVGSWGEIACRTAPNYRVEDCVQLGDSRPGLGLARALREAAWQFKIRPPRINGKPQIGAWVRIHYDIVEKGAEG